MAGITKLTSPSVPVAKANFAGGLNSTSGPLNVQDNEATDLQNVDFNKFGSFVKRNGYTRLNDTALDGGVTGLHWFQEVSGTSSMIAIAGSKIYYSTNASGTFTDITGALTITDSDEAHWNMITFNDQVGATNGTDVPIKVSNALAASEMTLPTNVTIPKYIGAFNNYTFIGVPTLSGTLKHSRVYWSNIDTLDTWTNTDFNDIGLDDGAGAITGLKVLGDRLVIFKERAIYIALFTGDADIPFTFLKTPSDVGAISGQSIQEIKNGLMFLAQDGFYFFDGSNSIKMSDRITTTLETFSRSRFANAVSAYQREKNRYWCSFTTSGSTEHNRVITWDSANNAFSVYNGHIANAYAIAFISGAERLYFGTYGGVICRADTTENDGDDTALSEKTIAFNDSGPDTIDDSGSGFDTDTLGPGDRITVEGSASNDGTYTIATVSTSQIVLIAGDELTNEAEGADVIVTRVSAIDAYLKTKWYNFGDIVDKKGIAHATIYHQIDNNSISFAYSYDFEEADQFTKSVDMSTSGAVYGTGVYGTATYSGSGGRTQRVDLTGRGRTVRFHISNSADDEGFQIDGIGLLPHLETYA